MRPVVFGPSPFMQAALGVLGGKQAGEQRAAAEAVAARKMAFEEEDRATKGQLNVLDIASRTLANEGIRETRARALENAARVQADADALRESPFGADGLYGKKGDYADPKFDYAGEHRKRAEKEAEIAWTASQLVKGGMKPEDARKAAEYDKTGTELLDKQKRAALEREKLRAGVAATKATAATGGAGTAVQRRKQQDEEAEGLAYLNDSSRTVQGPEMSRQFQAVRAAHPDWSPGRIGYVIKRNAGKVAVGREDALDRLIAEEGGEAAPAGPASPTPEQVMAWGAANPRQQGEDDAAYKARAKRAFGVAP